MFLKYYLKTFSTRSGFTFLGWSTSSTATSATYSAGGSYTANAGATLYAVWKINSVSVTFNPNGGELASLYTAPIENEYTVPITGNYKLEVWGAQGGGAAALVDSTNAASLGGYGGYSVGTINLTAGQKLYVNVGHGNNVASGVDNIQLKINGGYNGGGTAYTTSSNTMTGGGGGATHIATTSGTLASLSSHATNCKNSSTACPILIVAGGGGSFGYSTSNNEGVAGGYGGGYIGVSATYGDLSSTGGSQTAAGSGVYGSYTYFAGAFGQGGSADSSGGSGGGGGFYGGGGGVGGGGGSGYIGHPSLSSKSMYCYNCSSSSSTNTKTVSTTNYSIKATSNYAKLGPGAAKITLLTTSKTVTNGSTYGTLPTPYREGYTFIEWNTKSDGSGTTITSATSVNLTANQTIYAIWSSGKDDYKILYLQGNQYTTNSGGWINVNNSGSYTFNPSFNSSAILLQSKSTSSSIGICTANKINVTNYSILSIWTSWGQGTGSKGFGLYDGSNLVTSKTIDAGYEVGSYILDISDYNSSYYVCIGVSGNGVSSYDELDISGVFLIGQSANSTIS